MTYDSVLPDLRLAYDRDAPRRNDAPVDAWKMAEREAFLGRLTPASKALLEVGAGPGVNAKFFQDRGLDVTCTDLSAENVRLCREKGLEAQVMDFLSLDFSGRRFGAVFALNCLLHVPHADFAASLLAIENVIEHDGLFYLGQYGGFDFEGVWPEDTYEPQRYFAYFTDDQLRTAASQVFEIVDFHVVALDGTRTGQHFQSLTLTGAKRRRALL